MRITTASVVLVLAAFAFAPVTATTTEMAEAAPADAGLQFFEDQWKKAGKGIANKMWDVSVAARKSNLFQFAAEQAERVLAYDEDHKKAREYLGYEKKGKEWVADPDAVAKVKRQNMKNAKESQKTFDAKVDKWTEKRDKLKGYIAIKYAQVGKACGEKGYEEQELKGYTRALQLDPNCELAHKGMGHTKVGLLWLTKKQIKAINDSADGDWLLEDHEFEKGLGVGLNKMESLHFRVMDDQAREKLPADIKGLEALYAYMLADVGIDPATDVLGGKKIDLVIVSTQDVWNKWVDEFSNSADKEWTKESTTSRSYHLLRGGVFRVATAEHIDTRDPLLHHAAHFIAQHMWKARPIAWLDEGLAYYYTTKLQGTTRTSCLAKDVSGYGGNQEAVGGDKDWTISEFWNEYLVKMVRSNADKELRGILLTPVSTLSLQDSVKAWSVATWLMKKERETFIEFLKLVKEDPALDQEKALEKLFGRGIEALDKEWRAYALRAL